MFSKRRTYLDHASATLIDPRVARAVSKAQLEFPGNPSAPHEEGREARAAVTAARSVIARSFSIKPDELLFTSGGTEANNIAIHGFLKALTERGAKRESLHIITTTIEHSSVLKTIQAMEKKGLAVSYVAPEMNGIVRPEKIAAEIRTETVLITMAHVNSEIGTIQPIAEIASAAHEQMKKLGGSVHSKISPETIFPVIHADAAQSPLYLDAGPHALKARLVSYDAQKVGGPKGVGVLYRDFSVPLLPLYGGGTQERSIRPGTENVAGIVGAGVAFELAKEGRGERKARVEKLRDHLVSLVEEKIPDARFMGDPKRRIANNAHFVIPGVSGDYLAVLMDKEGVAVSPRSACIGSSEALSTVIFSLTGSEEDAKSTIRFSLGIETTARDCERAAAAFLKSVQMVRRS